MRFGRSKTSPHPDEVTVALREQADAIDRAVKDLMASGAGIEARTEAAKREVRSGNSGHNGRI